VLVVGGGPAGLEAARVAALRGHRVLLCERQGELGGQVLLSSRLPTREELAEIVFYLESRIRNLDVEVQLKTEVTPDLVQDIAPEVVILATGSRPLPGQFPGARQGNVVTCWDVLAQKASLGTRVVILDDDNGYAASGTAELLADRGKRVTLLTKNLYAGQDINSKARVLLYWRLFSKGVCLKPHTWIKGIERGTLRSYNVYSQEEQEMPGVDNLVLSLGGRANDELYHELKGFAVELHRIGDCLAPRKVQHAILEGHRVGRRV
jgi:NADPH-dependent 2,4-dienoyl-CoA reductase/sulfur reductase-like enzyme